MRLKILYHANCFDGCASAAYVGRFLSAHLPGRPSRIDQQPVQHQQGDPFPPGAFDGDVNACVDFRYSPSPALHWWFDHHQSAFPRPEDRAHFEADRTGRRFWDPKAPSCTGFIARLTRERFGFEARDLEDLVRWADVIDAARFPSAAMAVRLEEPALRIMTLLEATRDPSIPDRIIEAMRTRPLAELVEEPWVKRPLAPILESHLRSVETVRRLARVESGVVVIDLSESGLEAVNKFIAYDLFPEALYVVVVSRDAKRSKVSVGFNPWTSAARTHDVSRICERYGGGGHPVVGAVTLGSDHLVDARRIGAEIAGILRTPGEAAA